MSHHRRGPKVVCALAVAGVLSVFPILAPVGAFATAGAPPPSSARSHVAIAPRPAPQRQLAGQAAGVRPIAGPIYGVTLDCGYLPGQDGRPGLAQLRHHLPPILQSLSRLAKKPTVRVVFDENADPRAYIGALRKLHGVAYVMGELLDSSHLSHFGVNRYRARARDYFDTLGSLVDVWEIGNEVNGNWTGKPTTVAADITAAYDLARARGLVTAVTFYRQRHEAAKHEMFHWISANLPVRVRNGIDYALVSYYDNDLRVNWNPIFHRLAATFPRARVGFGEIGGDDTHSDRRFTVAHYYAKRIPGVRAYVGGYFYWYYCQDMVPYRTSDLWRLLDSEIARGRPAIPGDRGPAIRTMSDPTQYGVTADEVANPGQVAQSEHHLPDRPTTRIYFDVLRPARYYTHAVNALRPGSYVMGELLDSSDETKISVAAFGARVRSYLATFGGRVDIWEIGNEVNGDWLGSYRKVADRMIEAYDGVSRYGLRTALTLYYNVGCGDGPKELSPIAFTKRYVPQSMRDELDYVLLSYYESDCHGSRPSAAAWTAYFQRLHALYPNALLGFGEIGMNHPATAQTLPAARSLIRHYYGLDITYPYFIGGYFWWYYAEDCVPYRHKPLWQAIRKGFASEATSIGRR
ncbi:MAG: hypothetical protein ACR2KG_11145 [Nocardioidaceae bacterium]